MKKYLVFAGIGFELVGLILAAVYISDFLEKKFPSGGLIMVGLLLAVLAGWLVQVIWLLKQIKPETTNEDPS